jgi:hypothetical protein
MSGSHSAAGISRDVRRIEWTARVLQRFGDIIREWEDCRGAGWIELDAIAGTTILQSLATTFSRTLLTLIPRLHADHEGGYGGAVSVSALLEELVEAYTRLGGGIVRHAMAARLAVDRLKACSAR